MRIRSLLTLATLAAAATPLLAQRPAVAPMSLETIRKAVVTIHALDADGQRVASGTGFFVAPEGMVVTVGMTLGYPNENPEARSRKPLSELVRWESYS